MGMAYLLTSNRRSFSSSFRSSSLSLGSADLYPRYIHRFAVASQAIFSNNERTSFSSTKTESCQNPIGMAQLIISNSRSSLSSRTSNFPLTFRSFSSRSTRHLDREATHSTSDTGSSLHVNPFEQVYKLGKLLKHSPEDLLRAGIVKKAKTPEELETMKAKDWHDVIQLFYNCVFYPAKLRNPKITNSWAAAHLDAPEIKELGIDATWRRFISQLEKSKQMKGVNIGVIFNHPLFSDIKEHRAYMTALVASLERV